MYTGKKCIHKYIATVISVVIIGHTVLPVRVSFMHENTISSDDSMLKSLLVNIINVVTYKILTVSQFESKIKKSI